MEQVTRLCVIPFKHPSPEPNGNLRLCCAASTFNYVDETVMGNIADGLGQAWNSEKYRSIRRALLSGTDLPPYCLSCEYTSLGPAWALQFHVAIMIYNETRDEIVLEEIKKIAHRYDEYEKIMMNAGIIVQLLPSLDC